MKKSQGLLYPPKNKEAESKTIVARVTEEEWESIQEMRKKSSVNKELEEESEFDYESTMDCTSEDLEPWSDVDSILGNEYYCKCKMRIVNKFCEACCPTL